MSRFPLIVLLLFVIGTKTSAQDILHSPKYYSIVKHRRLGDDSALPLDKRFQHAMEAVRLSKELNIDSLILRSKRILSTVYLFQGEYTKFAKINYTNLKLSKRLKDTLATAIANHNLGYYHQHDNENDSAYYYYSNAIKLYEKIGDISSLPSAISNLSSIQHIEKDYFGSEENAIKALRIYEDMPATEETLNGIYILYDRLGNISLNLKQYDRSLDYHEKAFEVAKSMDNGYYNMSNSMNNVAFVHRKMGNFKRALELYRALLVEKELFVIDPPFYPLILDNIAFTKFVKGDKDYDTMEQMFKRAYKMADSLDDPIIKLATTIDMAKFYKAQNKIDSSLRYATETYKLAKMTDENDMRLESLMLLGELKTGEEGKRYLNEHIKLSDSLLQHERGVRNKFARVMFETDKIEQENERIATQRFWLLMVSIALLVTLFLLYIIITQRAKNKELQFEKEQQQTNEEIYNLMLSQQDKVDEARAHEKQRISEEMHDGILGRLFGTRLSLDAFNFKEGPEAAKSRLQYINDLKDIEQDIRKISHDLNTDFVAGSGFMDIVESLIQNQTQAYQLTYEFYHSDEINWENISNKTKIHIYRILQETMQNIYKHAMASQIKISFQLKNDVILLNIKDNGKGFIINKSKKGIGIKNINSRVNEVHGTLKIDSEIEKGTRIAIEIPYLEKQL